MEKNKKKKNSSWMIVLSSAFMMIVGGVCGYFMVDFAENSSDDKKFGLGYFLLAFAIMYLVFFIQIIIHEAGHLVCGLISGYKFLSFRIGSFMWVEDKGKIKFKRFSLAGTGGQCLMSPPEFVNDKIPFVLYNLGGSLANLFIGILCLGLFFIVDDIPLLSNFFMFMALIGGAFALMNGIPMRTGMVDNDGYNALSLGKDKAALRSFWIQMKTNEQISRGKRLNEMPPEWFEVPSDEKMKNSMVAVMGVFACNRLMDKHKFKEADELMKHLLEIDSSIVDLHRNLMICDRIYCELISENRKEALEEMYDSKLKSFMKGMKNFPSVIRTEYVYVLLHEKDMEKTDKIKEQFEKIAKTYPYPSDVNSERELMVIADEKKV